MALLSWNDQYLIGQPTIDDEHKTLFRLINDFHTHWSENRDRKDVARVLNQLIIEIFKLNEELADQSRLLERDITKFLKQWLVDHIVHNDYEFRNFLIRKRREAP